MSVGFAPAAKEKERVTVLAVVRSLGATSLAEVQDALPWLTPLAVKWHLLILGDRGQIAWLGSSCGVAFTGDKK